MLSYRKHGKRFFDLSVSLFSLIVLAPLLLLISLAVRLMLGTPVLFRQPRPGLHGHPFTLMKFRTMNDSRSKTGVPLPDGDRLTSLGRFLRSTSLDELPELVNVVRGDMSLVGPRPLLIEYLSLYSPEQQRRHDVLPGITGSAQVNGRNAISWNQRLAFDIAYVKGVNFRGDLHILWLTLQRVIGRTGISKEGHATMPKFKGSGSE